VTPGKVERVFAARQDDGQLTGQMFVVPVRGGHLLVQAAEQMLAAVGQVVPGVRAGDQQQSPSRLDDLGDLGCGVPGGGADEVGGGDLDQVPVGQQAQVFVQSGQGPGCSRLAGAGPAGKDQILPGRPADLDATRRRACSARSTAIRSAICPATISSPGSGASPPRSVPGAGAPFTAVIVLSSLAGQFGWPCSSVTPARKRIYRPLVCGRFSR
jgi:hypothetical protein